MQRLTYHRHKLEDGRTFESYGIGEGATIHLSRPNYAERDGAYYIYVQSTEGEVFRIRIKASDTIGSLKTHLWNGRLTLSGENNNNNYNLHYQFLNPLISHSKVQGPLQNLHIPLPVLHSFHLLPVSSVPPIICPYALFL